MFVEHGKLVADPKTHRLSCNMLQAIIIFLTAFCGGLYVFFADFRYGKELSDLQLCLLSFPHILYQR